MIQNTTLNPTQTPHSVHNNSGRANWFDILSHGMAPSTARVAQWGSKGFSSMELRNQEAKQPTSPTLVELSISQLNYSTTLRSQPRMPRIDFLSELVARDLTISVCFYRLSAGFNRQRMRCSLDDLAIGQQSGCRGREVARDSSPSRYVRGEA